MLPTYLKSKTCIRNDSVVGPSKRLAWIDCTVWLIGLSRVLSVSPSLIQRESSGEKECLLGWGP